MINTNPIVVKTFFNVFIFNNVFISETFGSLCKILILLPCYILTLLIFRLTSHWSNTITLHCNNYVLEVIWQSCFRIFTYSVTAVTQPTSNMFLFYVFNVFIQKSMCYTTMSLWVNDTIINTNIAQPSHPILHRPIILENDRMLDKFHTAVLTYLT